MRSNLMGKLWKSTILIKPYITTEDIRYSENSNRDKFFEIAEITNFYFYA